MQNPNPSPLKFNRFFVTSYQSYAEKIVHIGPLFFLVTLVTDRKTGKPTDIQTDKLTQIIFNLFQQLKVLGEVKRERKKQLTNTRHKG